MTLRKLILLILLIFLTACSMTLPRLPSQFNNLENAVYYVSTHLLTKLQNQQNLLQRFDKTTLIFNPILDANTGQVLEISNRIEELFFRTARSRFQNLKISRITGDNLVSADYLINGVIRYQTDPTNPKRLQRQIRISILDLKAYTLIAGEQIELPDGEDWNYRPTPSYEDNPIYIKDEHLKQFIELVESPVGSDVSAQFRAFLGTKAIVVQAQTAYDQQDYVRAEKLFQEAEKRPDGQTLEVYGGLYTAYYKLGQLSIAEQYFAKMVALGFKLGNLPLKILFQPQQIQFLPHPDLQIQYPVWLRQISLYLKENPHLCLAIIGHTSRYGLAHLNLTLSEKRAQRIQTLMADTFSGILQRSKTLGKGATETLVGTTPDGPENTIDRRVEFKVSACE